MKKLGILVLTVFVISCSSNDKKESQSVTDLEMKKEQLVAQLDSLTSELKLVEEELNKKSMTDNYQIVTVLTAKKEAFKHFIEVYGNVKAEKNIEIHPEMGGTVTQIIVKVGQYVSKGQTLMSLDASAINTSIEELKTRLELAKTAYDRQERLWQQQIGSEMQYLQAKNQKESLEKSLKSLQVQARKMTITAPFEGVIDYIFPKVGELSSPQYPLIRLVNLKSLYLEADVTESHLVDVKKGTPVQINFSSINKEVNATISSVGNFINPENRSFKVRVDLPVADNNIKPNLFGNININDFSGEGIVLPVQVLQKDTENNYYVYTVTKENELSKVVKKIVKIKSTYNNNVLLEGGLQENDLVIDKGSRTVNEGNTIIIK